MAELSRRFSPTVYGNNNAVRFIDPDGMQPKSYTSISGYYSSDLGAGGEQDNEAEKEDPKQRTQREDDKNKGNKKELPTVEQARSSNGLNPNGDGINPDYTIESTLIGGRVFKPVFGLLGRVWGGIFGASSKFGALTQAGKFGIAEASTLRQAVMNQFGRGSGLQVHHLIEQRFAKMLGQNADDMLSIVVTRAEHDVFTTAWRSQIGLNGWLNSRYVTNTATPQIIKDAAREIYKNYPEILKALQL